MTRFLLGVFLAALALPAAAQIIPTTAPSDEVTRETALDYAHASGRYAGLAQVCGAPLDQAAFRELAIEEAGLMDPTVLAEAETAFERGAAAMALADCGQIGSLLQQVRDDMAAPQGEWFRHIVAAETAADITVGSLE